MLEFLFWLTVLFCVAVVAFECGRKRGFARGKIVGEYVAKKQPYPPRPGSPPPAPPPPRGPKPAQINPPPKVPRPAPSDSND